MPREIKSNQDFIDNKKSNQEQDYFSDSELSVSKPVVDKHPITTAVAQPNITANSTIHNHHYYTPNLNPPLLHTPNAFNQPHHLVNQIDHIQQPSLYQSLSQQHGYMYQNNSQHVYAIQQQPQPQQMPCYQQQQQQQQYIPYNNNATPALYHSPNSMKQEISPDSSPRSVSERRPQLKVTIPTAIGAKVEPTIANLGVSLIIANIQD